MTGADRIHLHERLRSVVAALFRMIGLASCLAGCGTLRITLLADAATNQGRPLQVVVRSVDEQTYRSDSYAAASRLVTAPSSVVLRRLVLDPRPQLRRSFRIKPLPGRPVALYLLYTAPTGNWKLLLMPPLPFSVTVPLGRSGIAVEQVSEFRFRSPDSAPPDSPPTGDSAPSAPIIPGIPRIPGLPGTPSLPRIPSIPGPPTIPTVPIPTNCPCPPTTEPLR